MVPTEPSVADPVVGAVITPLRLSLLGGFELRRGAKRLEVPLSSQRVVAFLALHKCPVQRVFVAGSLWVDTSDSHAAASLRSALWRLRRGGAGSAVGVKSTCLSLGPQVDVDVHDLAHRAHRLLHDGSYADDDLASLAEPGDVLPDWYEDWALIERERLRQLRLNALDKLCALLVDAGETEEAVEVGVAAVACEPLRESAHFALMRAHVAAGNIGEALRQYRLYRGLLRQKLDLEPSPNLRELAEGLAGGGV